MPLPSSWLTLLLHLLLHLPCHNLPQKVISSNALLVFIKHQASLVDDTRVLGTQVVNTFIPHCNKRESDQCNQNFSTLLIGQDITKNETKQKQKTKKSTINLICNPKFLDSNVLKSIKITYTPLYPKWGRDNTTSTFQHIASYEKFAGTLDTIKKCATLILFTKDKLFLPRTYLHLILL